MLKLLDPISVLVPRMVRHLLGLPARPGLGCIIRPGGLGDLVLATKAFIETGFDPWRVVWIVEKRNKIWCDYLKLPYVCYDDPRGLLLSLQSTKGFDWVIDTEQSFGLSTCFACRLTPSDHLILGFYKHRGLQLLDSTFTVDRTRIHEFVAFKGLFEFASQHISILKLDKNPLNGLLPPLDQTDNCVVVIGGRQSKERAFALKDWVKIVNRYKKDYEHIILVGHHIDTKFAVELMVACPFIYFNYVGRITFGQTVDLIRSARQVVGVDSGLIHVASFFDRPTYAVFANERKAINWGPLGRNSEGVLVNQIRESS